MMPLMALAQVNGGGAFPGVNGGGSGGVNGGGQPTDCGGKPCSVLNPIKVTSICGVLKTGFNALLPLAVAVGVVFIIWSGFLFVLAQGNPKQLTKARQNFYYTIIGLAVVLGAWVIAEVIAATINAIGGSTIISCN